jgi:hypothetical protein
MEPTSLNLFSEMIIVYFNSLQAMSQIYGSGTCVTTATAEEFGLLLISWCSIFVNRWRQMRNTNV